MTDARYAPQSVDCQPQADGSLILKSRHALGPVAHSTGAWLHHWADATPDAVFIAERSGAGWREL
ncbi:MAG: feruloyl-CoA synthetase, partial [Lutimaribacter sp.]